MNASHISQHGDHGGLLLLHLPVGVHPIDPGEVRLPGHLEQAVPGGGARLRYKVLHMKIEKTFLFEDFLLGCESSPISRNLRQFVSQSVS